MDIYLLAVIISIGLNLVLFVPAYLFKTDKLTDISYSLTFIAVAIVGFLSSARSRLHWIILSLVLLWALRLGGFLLMRIWRKGRDKRFDGMRDKFMPFLRFWVLQGVTVFVVMLAALAGFGQKTGRLDGVGIVGVILFVIGWLLEAAADAQKYHFTGNPKNHGHWIDIGVWRISRHPNYLGEMMVWIGIYLVVVPTLSIASALVALLSPLFIICLLLFVSGIPLLEKSASAKWGDQAAFKRYQAEVPLLFPTPASIRRIGR